MCFSFWQQIETMFRLRCVSLRARVGIQTVASGQTVLHTLKGEMAWFVNLTFVQCLSVLVSSSFLFPSLTMIMQVED